MQEAFVSFVIIAYNEASNITHTVRAIAELEGLGDHEIIVVDDGSRDNTAQLVADVVERDPRVKLIALKENRGRGHARSRGIAEARGELIAMVDADVILPLHWLASTRAALGDHDAVGGIAVPDGDVAYVYKRFGLTPRIVRGTATVAGSNGLYRRRVFDLANFDPALREGEDIALNHAMNRQGMSVITLPELIVRHEESKTFGASLKWLLDTGRGATRQLITYRHVRQPDLAAGAFVGAVTVSIYLTMRDRKVIGAAIPVGFVLAASIQHVRSRFETPRSQWLRIGSAVVADSALLTAYFVGRLVGLTALRRRSDPAKSKARVPVPRLGIHVPRTV